jgi:hypothetical protein
MAGINSIIYLLSTLPTWVFTTSASQPIDNHHIDGTSLTIGAGAPFLCPELLLYVSLDDLHSYHLINGDQMATALGATGWFMYIDIPETPRAVVVCVIIYNAFFGYRYVTSGLL